MSGDHLEDFSRPWFQLDARVKSFGDRSQETSVAEVISGEKGSQGEERNGGEGEETEGNQLESSTEEFRPLVLQLFFIEIFGRTEDFGSHFPNFCKETITNSR